MAPGRGNARLAFRVVALIGGALHVVPIVFLSLSVASATDRIHVVHNTAGVALFTCVIGFGWILAAIRPERMIAPFQAATLGVLAVVIASVISADPQGGSITVAIGIVLLALHPARALLFRMGRTAPGPLALASLAAVPAVGFALSNASIQRNGMPMDPHVQMHHWTGMVAFALGAVLVAVVAGLGGPNRRLMAIATGFAAVLFGGMSLAYSTYPGAVSMPWAIGCLLWGVALAGDGYRMAREPAADTASEGARA